MSEWIKVKDNEHVELSSDGKEVEVLLEQNRFGNVYVVIPVEFIRKVLPDAAKS